MAKKKKINKKTLLIAIAFVCLFFTTIAYSGLSTKLAIISDVMLRPNKIIRVTNIKLESSEGEAIESYSPKYDVDKTTTGFILPNENSSITYRVTVTNSGDLDQVIYLFKKYSANTEGLNVQILTTNKEEYQLLEDGNYTGKDKIIEGDSKTEFLIKFSTTNPSNDVINLIEEYDFRIIYPITFDANGGNNAPDSIKKIEDVDITLPSESPAKNGYAFKGWSLKKDSIAVEYKAGDIFSDLVDSNGNITNTSVILYAVWEIKTAQLDLNYNVDGTWYYNGYNSKIYTGLKVDGVDYGYVEEFSENYKYGTEYEIYGFKLDGQTINYSKKYTVDGTNHLDIYINTIDFKSNNSNYGTIGTPSMLVVKGTTFTISNNIITLSDGRTNVATLKEEEGYTTKFTGYTYTPNSTTINEKTVVTANFTRDANNYTITYNNNGLKNYLETNNTITLSGFSGKDNHCFTIGKFYTNGLEANDKVIISMDVEYSETTKTSDPDARFYAQGEGDVTEWTSGVYFSSSNYVGTGKETYISTISLSNSQLSNSYFKMYIRTNYYTGGTIKLSNIKITKTTTKSETKVYGDTLGTLPNASETGYTFDGWYTKATGGEKVTSSTSVPAANTTYYAHWTANELTFDGVSKELTYTGSAQDISINNASNGTGNYKYSITNGNTNNYFSISGTIVTASKDTPAGTYNLTVTAEDTGSGKTKDATVKVTIKPATLSGSVKITGTNTWGNILTATVTNPDDATLTYQWYYSDSNSVTGGTKITDATSSTYTIDKSMVGKYIYVVANATKENYDNASFSDITDVVAKQNLSVTVSPFEGTYDGNAHTATIKVNSSEWNGSIVSGESTSYGTTVVETGAYNTSYNLKPIRTNVGTTTVYYKVTGGNYYNDITGSTSVKINNATLSGSVKITGTNTWGNTLTATVTNTNSATLTYQWYYSDSNSVSGGTAITGATSSTYVVAEAYTGKYIYVVVGASKANYNNASFSDITDASTNTTATVAKKNLSGSVKITGTNTWGNTLTASVTNTNSATLTYQWYYNSSNSVSGGTKITGATSDTYTIDKSLVGKYIYVVVTATKANYNNASFSDITDSSNTTATVAKQNLSVTASSYTGTYDGSAHSATIKVNSSEWNGKTIVSGESTSYGSSVTTSGVYNTNYNLLPSRTNSGTTTVYYKVTGGSYYNDITGSTSVKINNANLSGSVKITGTNTWGNTLTASVTNTNSATLTYQWYYNSSNSVSGGTKITGATSSTYTVDKSLVGKYIYVVVGATKANYNSSTWSNVTSTVVDKKENPIKVTANTLTYNASSQSLVTVSNDEGNVCYSTTSAVTSCSSAGTIPVQTNAGTYTVYYYVSGNESYKPSSGSVSVTIKQYNISNATISGISSKTYTGSEITQSITVTVPIPSGKTSTPTYTTAYSNNINVGTATITLTGTGNYTGTKSSTFSITQKGSTCTITSVPTLKYPSNATGTIKYSCTGDGAITVSSSNTGIISVSNKGTTSATLTASTAGMSTITVSQASGSNYSASASVTSNVTVTYSTYTVTLNGNGATKSGSASAVATYNNASLSSITNPIRSYTITYNINNTGATSSLSTGSVNYTFNGWYSATSSGTLVASNSTTPSLQASVSGYTDANKKWTKTSNTTLYAGWTEGSTALATLSKTGNTCTWNTKSDGTGTSYASGKTGYTTGSNVTLYAVCTKNKYSLTVNPNGGTYSGSTSATVVTQDYGSTYGLSTPTKTGYTFSSWTHSGSGSLTRGIAKGNPASLYGFKNEIKTDTDGSQYTNYSVTSTPTDNIWYHIEYPYYKFTAGHTYKISLVLRVNAMSGGSLDLRHSCIANDYSSTGRVSIGVGSSSVGQGWVEYSMSRTYSSTTLESVNGSSNVTINPLFQIYTSNLINQNVNMDFDIKNIRIYDETSGTYVSKDTYGGYIYEYGAGSGTLTANYTPNTYTVTLNNQGATTAGTTTVYYQYNTTKTINNITCYYYTDAALSTCLTSGYKITVPTKTGYTFGGYYTGTNGTGTQYIDSSGNFNNALYKSASQNTTLYAKWTVNSYYYDVNPDAGIKSFDINVGGTVTTGLTDFHQLVPYGTNVTISNVVAKTGYTYSNYIITGGVSKLSDSTNATIKTQMGASTGAVALKATINSYTVTYDYATNGGTSASKTSASVNYNSAIDLTPTATKSGYTFVGWNTSKTATTGLSSLTMGTSNVTLYAIYKKTLTATFNYYNSLSTTSSVTIYNTATSGSITAPVALGTPDGYTFRHYSTSSAANSSSTLSAGEVVTISSNMTYYASYQKSVTVTFYYTSGDTNSNKIASTTSSGVQYIGYDGTIVNSSVSIPSEVSSSETYQYFKYTGLSTTEASNTLVSTVTTEYTTYYAVYYSNIDYYYYDGTKIAKSTGGLFIMKPVGVPRFSHRKYINKPSTPNYNGMEFADWNEEYNKDGNAIFKAYYSPETFEITYHYYDGSDSVTQTVAADIEVTINIDKMSFESSYLNIDEPSDIFESVKDGYTIKGFNISGEVKDEFDYDDYDYILGVTFDEIPTDFYVLYEGEITVSYDVNGGAGTAPSSQSGTVYMNYAGEIMGASITTQKNSLTKTGYTANGWNANSAGTGTIYNNSTAYTFTANTTLYAKWKANAISLAGSTKTFAYSTAAQSFTISSATNGTGSYTYAITGGNTSSYFSISGTTITMKANTPSNTYSLTVKATDSNSGSTASATITVRVYATITLVDLDSDYTSESRTSKLYILYGTGIYKDTSLSTLMTTSTNGITVPTISMNIDYKNAAGLVTAGSFTASYEFNGYYTASSSGTQLISSTGYITSSFTNTLYNVNANIYMQKGAQTVTLPSNPTLGDYVFEGWYTKGIDGTKVSTSYDFLGNKTTLIYGHWITTPVITGGSADWTSTSRTITLSTASTSSSGSVSYEYYLSTSNTSQTGGSWTAITSSDNSVTISQSGAYYIYYRAKSVSGTYSNVSNYQTIKIDNVVPSTTITAYKLGTTTKVTSNTWTNSYLTYKFGTVSSAGSGGTIYYCIDTDNTCTPETIIGSNTSISEDLTNAKSGIYYVRYKVIGGTGISSSVSTYTAKIDMTAPTCKWSGESTTWTNSDRTIKLACSDSDSGCKTSTRTLTYQVTQKTSDKSYTITDNAGNSTTCSKTLNVYVDKTDPAVLIVAYEADDDENKVESKRIKTISNTEGSEFNTKNTVINTGAAGQWITTAIYFDLSSTKDSASGLKSIIMQINKAGISKTGSSEETSNLTGSSNLTSSKYKVVGGSGNRYIRFTITDNAGNSVVRNIRVHIDRGTPGMVLTMRKDSKDGTKVKTLSDNNNVISGWINYNPYFDLTGSKDEISGIYSIQLYYNSPNSSSDTHDLNDTPLTITSDLGRKIGDEGSRYLRFIIKDNAYNTTTRNVRVRIDTTAPKLTWGSVSGSSVNYTCSDSLSGIKGSTSGSAAIASLTSSTGQATATCTDNAGNSTTSSSSTYTYSSSSVCGQKGEDYVYRKQGSSTSGYSYSCKESQYANGTACIEYAKGSGYDCTYMKSACYCSCKTVPVYYTCWH